MTIFLTGCTHFGHDNIIGLCKRPFKNAHEMDRALIENWNSVVSTDDEVYHLGDFAWHGMGEKYLDKLNGKITLIKGNHDPEGWGVDYLNIKFKKLRAVLFHFPIEEWDGFWRGAYHFHCHTHKKEFVSAKRRGNVGVDATNFTPISLERALERLDKAHQ